MPDAVVQRCLAGELSPAMAAMHLLLASGDAAGARAAIAAAEASVPRDPARLARLRELARLIDDRREGTARIFEMLRGEHDASDRAASPEDQIEAIRRLFDWSVQQSAETSVALYSLGDPEILKRATAEVVARMRDWGLLAPDRRLLEIGCGIGRFQAALAETVAEAVGIDVSERMIAEARRRCGHLPNVRFLQCSGRDLSLFGDGRFDLVFAVDSFPYLMQTGMALVERHFAECARVLQPGGDLLILNFSYRNALDADRTDMARLAGEAGFALLRNGERAFTLWDGAAFHLRLKRQA